MTAHVSTDGLARNPFFVLELPPNCSRQQVEREGQKLLGLLELGLARAATYSTPLGPQPRTPELVRGAMAQLRDPVKRIFHELWADKAPPGPATEATAEETGEATNEATAEVPDSAQAQAPPPTNDQAGPWPEVWALFDWRLP